MSNLQSTSRPLRVDTIKPDMAKGRFSVPKTVVPVRDFQLRKASAAFRGSKPAKPIDLTPEAPEPVEIPTRKQPWKRPTVHKGNMSCCRECNPSGYQQARHRKEKESAR